jgi:hypothetical protein
VSQARGRVTDNPISGERIVIRQTAAETGGRLLAFDLFLPPEAMSLRATSTRSRRNDLARASGSNPWNLRSQFFAQAVDRSAAPAADRGLRQTQVHPKGLEPPTSRLMPRARALQLAARSFFTRHQA